jgi:hypothetical protein
VSAVAPRERVAALFAAVLFALLLVLLVGLCAPARASGSPGATSGAARSRASRAPPARDAAGPLWMEMRGVDLHIDERNEATRST